MSDPQPPKSDFEGSEPPVDDPDAREWNGLRMEMAPFKLEHLEDYEPSGHHPVHLGDALGDGGRYRVVHKLGSGGYATVWLCRDLKWKDTDFDCQNESKDKGSEGRDSQHSERRRYIALKILMADVSLDDCGELNIFKLKEQFGAELSEQHLSMPLDHFKIDGPNGLHFCFVYPVLGPRICTIMERLEDPERVLRNASFQITQAMAALHSHGLCHGDLTPSNVLLQLSDLNGLDEDQVIQALGEPILNKVRTDSGETPVAPGAPKYLVYPIDFSDVSPTLLSDTVCVIDLGVSYEISKPPKDLSIPRIYCPPEVLLTNTIGIESDIWALACTIYRMRTGVPLFGYMDMFGEDLNEHLTTMVWILGKMPEPWWTTTWEGRKTIFKDETDSDGKVILVEPSENCPSSIQREISRGLYLDECREVHRAIDIEEAKMLADLLGKMLRYNPSERISTKEALDHEWFKM
ncbi:hypothetical protein FQN49_000830 [Arthroderma sp. PD_2]|nr:hypothetical protein FQN49_000830 [Arthroderma sp. PD_2]